MSLSGWLKDYAVRYNYDSPINNIKHVYNSIFGGTIQPNSVDKLSSNVSSTMSNVDNLYRLINTQTANNAMSASLAAARETNSFNERQAEINRQFQATSARQAMEFERQMANQSMEFSERMANTQYQRAVEDLKAAGLSPLLAYENLQTAAPSGVSASGHTAGGSQASGVKADVSSAAGVQREREKQLIDVLALNINSAIALKKLQVDMRGQNSSAISSTTSSVLSGLTRLLSGL